MVDNLVQKYREVEDGEALDQRERNPGQGRTELDEAPGGEAENRELARRDEQVGRDPAGGAAADVAVWRPLPAAPAPASGEAPSVRASFWNSCSVAMLLS